MVYSPRFRLAENYRSDRRIRPLANRLSDASRALAVISYYWKLGAKSSELGACSKR